MSTTADKVWAVGRPTIGGAVTGRGDGSRCTGRSACRWTGGS